MTRRSAKKELLVTLVFGVLVAGLCIILQHSVGVMEFIYSKKVVFERAERNTARWEANILSLPPEQYFISAGRPRAPCDLFLGSNKLASTRSEVPGLRNSLLLGATLVIPHLGTAEKLIIDCEAQGGVVGNFTHEPVVSLRSPGMIIHLWRAITELLMGPVASLFILTLLLWDWRWIARSRKLSVSTIQRGLEHFFFGASTFFYSLSLAYYPRLFLAGGAATAVHVVTRNVYSLAVLLVFSTTNKLRRPLVVTQGFFLFVSIAWALISSETIFGYYQIEYTLFPILSALLLSSDLLKPARSKSELFLRVILVSWTIVQSLDWMIIWTSDGAYTAPSVIVMLCASVFYLRELQRRNTLALEQAVSNILRAVDVEDDVQSVLKAIAQISQKETHYSRVSAYVDGFCLGVADEAGRSFYRVFENGYRKGTSKDAVIDFSEGRGKFMAEAIRTGKVELKLGQDESWFIVVPLGDFACINLSDDQPKSDFIAYESLEILERILPSLRTIDRKLIEQGTRQGIAMQKLRALRGDGSWEEEVGMIFLDVNEYSKVTEAYGDSFAAFVSQVYIPGLIKAVSRYAVQEHVIGDEVYFVVISDLIEAKLSISEATFEAIKAIDQFVYGPGAKLCSKYGFPELTVSIGGNVGRVTIVSDSIQVRTSGKEINEAKRLLEDAGKDRILVKASAVLPLNDPSYRFGEEFLVLRKKNVIPAKRLLRTGVAGVDRAS